MKNSKQHLTDAFSQLQDAQINLKHALDNAEKLNNKERIQSTLSIVNEAVFAAANTVANYQDSNSKYNQSHTR
ncbi:MAG TPA: hypothetical protein K8V90_05415 [Romboutsia timonensis]|uniref:Uncharacterized protein n=1 Tax=Romboutsia timonensis TaxID=1776391 RepID=A0A921N1A0_9FIRM|nr:hypothetical protein [uncultured Romboutsia sp.]HJG96524.1 hypothetical protein [Romboutsia timonensis]